MIRRIPRDQAPVLLPWSDTERIDRARTLVCEVVAVRAAVERVRRVAASQVAQLLRQLVQGELQTSTRHIESLVDRELARLRRASSIQLFVHPQDAPLLAPVAELWARHELCGELVLQQDPALTRGGARLVSSLGDVDASIETRLDAAVALLREALEAVP